MYVRIGEVKILPRHDIWSWVAAATRRKGKMVQENLSSLVTPGERGRVNSFCYCCYWRWGLVLESWLHLGSEWLSSKLVCSTDAAEDGQLRRNELFVCCEAFGGSQVKLAFPSASRSVSLGAVILDCEHTNSLESDTNALESDAPSDWGWLSNRLGVGCTNRLQSGTLTDWSRTH